MPLGLEVVSYLQESAACWELEAQGADRLSHPKQAQPCELQRRVEYARTIVRFVQVGIRWRAFAPEESRVSGKEAQRLAHIGEDEDNRLEGMVAEVVEGHQDSQPSAAS